MIKSVYRPKNIHFTKCYYCVCTACSEKFCPHKDPCYNCKLKNKKNPKLDCDYFTHSFVRFYKIRKTTSANFTFCIYYKGTKIAKGLTYEEMRHRIRGKSNYIVKIDKVIHPYDIW